MKLDILARAGKKLAPVAMKLAQRKPEIFIAGGVLLMIGGTVMACKATVDAKEAVDEIVEETYGLTEPKEKAMYYANLGTAVAVRYAPAVMATVGGAMLIFKGHGELRARMAALGAAYTTMAGAYSEYRKRVIEEHGEEADRLYRLGVRKEQVEDIEVGEDGTESTVKRVVETVHSDGFGYSMYARYFDQFNSNEHMASQADNYDFLMLKQSWANERLQRRGFLFLNEVYEELGFDYIPEGWLVGWKLGNGDGFVDFGLFEARNSLARDAVRYNGKETCFVLDFNVDGPIWDII